MLSPKNPNLITPPLNYDFGLRKENGKYDWYMLITLPTKEEVTSHPAHSEWIWIKSHHCTLAPITVNHHRTVRTKRQRRLLVNRPSFSFVKVSLVLLGILWESSFHRTFSIQSSFSYRTEPQPGIHLTLETVSANYIFLSI